MSAGVAVGAVVERKSDDAVELLVDSRLRGCPRRYLGRPGERLMRLADEVRKCAVFLCHKDVSSAGEEIYKPAGTGFFVSIPYAANLYRGALYIVTAKHLVDDIPKVGMDGMIYLRMNRKDGGPEIIGTAPRDWHPHPSEKHVDVAVLRPNSLAHPLDIAAIPIAMAATPDVRKQEGTGVGDEISIVGLFVNHYGRARNLPIVRTGNIALMPEEPLVDADGSKMDAFLVEARSIGGLSGSPVFVRVAQLRGGRGGGLTTPSPMCWLGLMHGHWEGGLTEADAVGRPKEERVNVGIAIVVPVEKIIEVLNRREFVEEREAMAGRYQQGEPPVED